jgi:hypothetical protein
VNLERESGELIGSFDGRTVTYGCGELDVLVPAYAVTIHKRQGSEYPAAIIPVLTQHYPMLRRNLLYTGVTRGKRLVVLVGQKKTVTIADRNASSRRCWSKLDESLRLAASGVSLVLCAALLTGASTLAGCQTTHLEWRADTGQPVDQLQFHRDMAGCHAGPCGPETMAATGARK